MSSPQKVYTEEFKREAVRLSHESGLGITEVASDLGVGRSTLIKWRRQFRDDALMAADEGNSEQELSRLRRENQILRAERDLLTKATAFFARETSR